MVYSLGNCVEIGGEAGKGDVVEALGQHGVVRQDQTGGRTTEALVGTHRHQVRALRQRLDPRDHAQEARLAGAGLAEHGPARARGDGQIERTQPRRVAVAARRVEATLHHTQRGEQRSHHDRGAVARVLVLVQ